MKPYVFDPMQPYQNRNHRLADLDDRVFDLCNEGLEGNFLWTHGCLDALDSIPAGSCDGSPRGAVIGPTYVTRGVSSEERRRRDAIADRLIAEILQEGRMPGGSDHAPDL